MEIGPETIFAIAQALKELMGEKAEAKSKAQRENDGKLSLSLSVVIIGEGGSNEIVASLKSFQKTKATVSKFTVDEDRRNLSPDPEKDEKYP